MSSRFVSAGAIDPSTGEAAAIDPNSNSHDGEQSRGGEPQKPNDEWLAVERELAAERRRRDEHRAAAAASGEKSLYEILQANKEAKQAAFEEANKIKNQFRALDDDEIDFLDEVKARQRAEEARMRRETEQSLEAFRAAQQRSGPRAEEGEDEAAAEDWLASAAGRKRKRDKDKGKGVGIVKRRTTSEGAGEVSSKKSEGKIESSPKPEKAEERKAKGEIKATYQPAAAVAKGKLGLVSYDSDDDD